MDTVVIIIAIVVIAALLLGAAAIFGYQGKRRSEHLRDRFGPEYDRVVSQEGRGGGEKELKSREERVSKLDIRDLDTDERRRYAERWRTVQADFVDAPETAIIAADDLVREVMASRGYPVADFEQRAADLSVRHPEFVSNYRRAHATSQAHRQQPRSTEELRQAMIHYRALFSDLLGEPVSSR
jgi:hypothetical protein